MCLAPNFYVAPQLGPLGSLKVPGAATFPNTCSPLPLLHFLFPLPFFLLLYLHSSELLRLDFQRLILPRWYLSFLLKLVPVCSESKQGKSNCKRFPFTFYPVK